MKSFVKKIVAIILALNVLFITTSYTIDYHFCSQNLVDISVLGHAESCVENNLSNKCMMESGSCDDELCCSNYTIVKEGHKDLKMNVQEIDIDKLTFLHSFLFTYVNLFEGLEQNIVPSRDYVPPLISRDIQVLHEAFLI